MLFDLDTSGDRVEAMLANGRKIMREAIETYKPVAVFACYSSGKDSVVSGHFAATEFGAQVLTVNTGIGMQKSLAHAKEVCSKFGWSLEIKQAQPEGPPKTMKDGSPFDPAKILKAGVWNDGATPYEELCFNFGMPGPAMHGRVYQRLKERAFDAAKREAKVGQHRHSKVLFVSGIRHDESSIRAGYKRAIHCQPGSASVWVNPFYWQTAADFELYRQEYGLPCNPVSKLIGISGE